MLTLVAHSNAPGPVLIVSLPTPPHFLIFTHFCPCPRLIRHFGGRHSLQQLNKWPNPRYTWPPFIHFNSRPLKCYIYMTFTYLFIYCLFLIPIYCLLIFLLCDAIATLSHRDLAAYFVALEPGCQTGTFKTHCVIGGIEAISDVSYFWIRYS